MVDLPLEVRQVLRDKEVTEVKVIPESPRGTLNKDDSWSILINGALMALVGVGPILLTHLTTMTTPWAATAATVLGIVIKVAQKLLDKKAETVQIKTEEKIEA